MVETEDEDGDTIFDDLENKRLAGVLLFFSIFTSLLLSALFFSSIAALASSWRRPKFLLFLARALCSASFFETRRLLEVYWGSPDIKDIYGIDKIKERIDRASVKVKIFLGVALFWVCLSVGDSVLTDQVPDLVVGAGMTAEALFRTLFLLNEDSARADGGSKFLKLRALRLARV
jgi:hypothetical protein